MRAQTQQLINVMVDYTELSLREYVRCLGVTPRMRIMGHSLRLKNQSNTDAHKKSVNTGTVASESNAKQ